MGGLPGADTWHQDSMTDCRCGLLMGWMECRTSPEHFPLPQEVVPGWLFQVSPIHALCRELGGAAGFLPKYSQNVVTGSCGEVLTFRGRTWASPSTPSSLTAHSSQHGLD